MPVNKKLAPVKGHYFFFNAGTAPLVPYLSTYARQLGFSSSTVGLIYTVLPIFGLFAKPLFGAIADKYSAHKKIFLIFQVVTILSFSAIFFIPHDVRKISVALDCPDAASVPRTCYPNDTDVTDKCKVDNIPHMRTTTTCKMTCNKTSIDMWTPVCQQYYIPSVCIKRINSNGYDVLISNVSATNDCLNIITDTVDFGKGSFNSSCRMNDIYEACYFQCSDPTVSAITQGVEVNSTCVDKKLSYKVCNNNFVALTDSLQSTQELRKCKVHCNSTMSAQEIQLCEVLDAEAANFCRIRDDDTYPSEIKFDASLVIPQSTFDRSGCIFIDIEYVKMNTGSVYYLTCNRSNISYTWPQEYKPQCHIKCENAVVKDILDEALENTKDNSKKSQYSSRFWVFLIFMIISWVGQAVVVTFADAICFNILGHRISLYGKQRLWGSLGWGTVSLLTGVLIDAMSEGEYKNYTIAFILMFIFMIGDVVTSCFIEVEPSQMSLNMLKDVGSMLSSYGTVLFLIWTIAVGLCTGMIWQFLFWHIEDIAKVKCDAPYVKTIQGLVSAIQTFGGEIPFMFLSGYILQKFGHNHVMSAVLFGFGLRFILYSYLVSAWWILPIELFQGLTSGMFYPTITSYANIVAPPGTKTTVQGLVGAIFEGVGSSLGSFIGGFLFEQYGGWLAFRYFGYGAIVAGGLHAIAIRFVKKENRVGFAQGNKNLE